jgi:hypothetical protein
LQIDKIEEGNQLAGLVVGWARDHGHAMVLKREIKGLTGASDAGAAMARAAFQQP